MTDRELLELAAKAVGIELGRWDGTSFMREDSMYSWNPLIDDGDALRLAVRLGMNVYASSGVIVAEIIHDGDYASTVAKESWKGMDGKEVATRRAIVRAAAEIQLSQGKV